MKEEEIKRIRAIQNGISKEALKVLEEVFEANLDVFQFTDSMGHYVNKPFDVLQAEALKRDGQISVIRWIKQHKQVEI